MIPAPSPLVVAKPDASGLSDAWARLIGGGVAEARVVSVTQAGLVKLLLDGMQTSATLSAPVALAAGDRVALQRVEGSTIAMVRLAPGQLADQSLFQGDGRPAVATLVADASMLRPARPEAPPMPAQPEASGVTSGDRNASPAPRPVPQPIETEAQARAALLPMARAAMATQIPLPEMFARLQAALETPAPQSPPALRSVMSAVLGLSFDPEAPAAPQALRDRVEGAGVFYEARMVAGDGRGAPRGDVKAGLLTLRGLLAELVGQIANDKAPAASSDPRAAVAPADGTQKNPPGRAFSQTVIPQASSSSSPPSLLKSDSLPIASTERSALPSAQTEASEMLAKVTGNTTPEPDIAPQLLRNALMRLVGASNLPAQIPAQQMSAAPAAPSHVGDDPPAVRPPLRGELSPLQQIAPRNDGEAVPPADRAEQATSLLRDVDGAIDRLRLLQFASLNDRAAVEFAKEGGPSRQWQVEIPLALPNNAFGALPLMIERDDKRGVGAVGAGRAWRMRFTTETPELGAVDVAITLRDGRIDVRFWADREETASLIDAARGNLSEQIESEAAPVETIRCQAGRRAAPRTMPTKPGQFMDVQS